MVAGVSDEQVASVPGWFPGEDVALFRCLLGEQRRRGQSGDLAEIGVYLGASAVLIGAFQQAGEVFTVVDLFESSGQDEANKQENAQWYDGLSQDRFEQNYRRLHGELPVVVRGLSTAIRDHAAPGRHRFVHVDASHLYEHVVADVETARQLLQPEGIVVFDDYRSAHAPGVAAAVWPEVAQGLAPIVLTAAKLYATWGDPAPWRAAVDAWLPASGMLADRHRIAGRDVARVWRPPPSPLLDWIPPRLVPAALAARAGVRAMTAQAQAARAPR